MSRTPWDQPIGNGNSGGTTNRVAGICICGQCRECRRDLNSLDPEVGE